MVKYFIGNIVKLKDPQGLYGDINAEFRINDIQDETYISVINFTDEDILELVADYRE
jgi:hypothetical protein